MLTVDSVQLLELHTDYYPRMRELMWEYHDLPMDLADAWSEWLNVSGFGARLHR